MEQQPRKLLDQVRDAIRLKNYSYQTEQTYVDWIRRYILYHDKRHPKEMGSREIEAFLTYLAVERNVAASTQNQALSALLFLYREVLRLNIDLRVDAVRARKPKRLPAVLTKEEVRQVIGQLSGTHQLMAQLHPHGAGTPRPQGRENHHDLHPRPEPGRAGGAGRKRPHRNRRRGFQSSGRPPLSPSRTTFAGRGCWRAMWVTL